MSEKTIGDKLYLKNAKTLALFNGGVHPAVRSQLPQALIDAGAEGEADVVLMFALNQAELEQYFPEALQRLGEKGALWVAYLKQTASKATDLTRDSINDWAKQHGATGVAMITVDSDWSALRFKRL